MQPFVFINVATTVDGKIAPSNRRFTPFSSKRDQKLLMQLRATADAVMCGARTINLTAISLGPGSLKYRQLRLKRGLSEFNLRILVSGSASLDLDSEIFKHRFSPIIVLTTKRAPKKKLCHLAKFVDEIMICGKEEVDFQTAFFQLHKKWKVRRLLCEGGGELNESLLRAGVVDKIYLTISPLIFGGQNAPTLADGKGVQDVLEARRLKLQSYRRFGSELFLIYHVLKSRPMHG